MLVYLKFLKIKHGTIELSPAMTVTSALAVARSRGIHITHPLPGGNL